MTFSGRQPSAKDKVWWKKTFGGRQPLVEDDLQWKTAFSGRRPLLEDNLAHIHTTLRCAAFFLFIHFQHHKSECNRKDVWFSLLFSRVSFSLLFNICFARKCGFGIMCAPLSSYLKSNSTELRKQITMYGVDILHQSVCEIIKGKFGYKHKSILKDTAPSLKLPL